MDIRWTAVQLNLQSWNVENLVVLDCDQLIRWSDGSFLVGGDKEQLLPVNHYTEREREEQKKNFWLNDK